MNAPETKDIVISRIPAMQTIINHAWGEWHRMAQKNDQTFLNLWKYAHVAEFLCRRSISPKGYISRRHFHILPQIANPDTIKIIDEEFKRRGLEQKYTLWIEIK